MIRMLSSEALITMCGRKFIGQLHTLYDIWLSMHHTFCAVLHCSEEDPDEELESRRLVLLPLLEAQVGRIG